MLLISPLVHAGEAMGLSFSVPPGVRVPPSLQNMYKELANDLGCKVPNHGCLEKVCSIKSHINQPTLLHTWEMSKTGGLDQSAQHCTRNRLAVGFGLSELCVK